MKKILLIRERFHHMGSFSGYDVLFENKAFKDSTSFFLGESLSVKSVIRNKKAFNLLGISVSKYALILVLSRLRLVRIRDRKSISGQIFDDLTRNHNLVYTKFYKTTSLLQEVEVIECMLKNPLAPYYVHLSYAENMFGLLASKSIRGHFPNLKIICTVHQPMSWWRLFGNVELLRNADALIVLSESERIAWERIYPEKTAYIPHGVCTDFFVPTARRETGFSCVFAGQWLRDFALLADIVDKCAEIDKTIKFNLIIPAFARNNETNQRAMYRLANHENVYWYGSLDDAALRTVYQSSHVLVMPLLACTANNAILESMACGLPVIASRMASLDSYVSPEYSLQIAGMAPLEFVDDILRYKNSPAELQRAAVFARKGAESKEWTDIADRTLSVYQCRSVL